METVKLHSIDFVAPADGEWVGSLLAVSSRPASLPAFFFLFGLHDAENPVCKLHHPNIVSKRRPSSGLQLQPRALEPHQVACFPVPF